MGSEFKFSVLSDPDPIFENLESPDSNSFFSKLSDPDLISDLAPGFIFCQIRIQCLKFEKFGSGSNFFCPFGSRSCLEFVCLLSDPDPMFENLKSLDPIFSELKSSDPDHFFFRMSDPNPVLAPRNRFLTYPGSMFENLKSLDPDPIFFFNIGNFGLEKMWS